MNENQKLQCVNCERTVQEVPLVPLVLKNGQAYICPQCIPVLIHKPQVLIGKLAGAESLQPHEH
ncbi:MAG: hypothetical protein HY741_05270 [Chloroflexi bacterium]|nr:hypothetical protein [Chloroflexota bacterium]